MAAAPIEEKHRAVMNGLAQGLNRIFNGPGERHTGFVLLVFPFGEAANGICNYISNGASRGDIAKLFREMAAKFEGEGKGHDDRPGIERADR